MNNIKTPITEAEVETRKWAWEQAITRAPIEPGVGMLEHAQRVQLLAERAVAFVYDEEAARRS